MIIKKESLLQSLRSAGPCGICGKPCLVRDVHHLQSRGAGGGYRLDIACNLVSVGPCFVCPCHGRAQRYDIPREIVLELIAKREGTTADAIERCLAWLNRADDAWSSSRLEDEIDRIPIGEVQELVRLTLREKNGNSI